jgi:hypothetical protein
MSFPVVQEPFCSTSSRARSLIHHWLFQCLSVEAFEWLSRTIAQSQEHFSERAFYTAFSSISRRVGKQPLTTADGVLAEAICPGWNPSQWSVDLAARSLLLLSLPQAENGQLSDLFHKLQGSADIAEAIALQQTLPLLPYGDRYRDCALEGCRSQITSVFNAIALSNPYPAQHFDQLTWNQMILKVIFVESPLNSVWGMGERVNAELSRMLTDYVHERQAAGRSVVAEVYELIL